MFKTNVPKFFYLTAPFSYDQELKVYFGNFVMEKISFNPSARGLLKMILR